MRSRSRLFMPSSTRTKSTRLPSIRSRSVCMRSSVSSVGPRPHRCPRSVRHGPRSRRCRCASARTCSLPSACRESAGVVSLSLSSLQLTYVVLCYVLSTHLQFRSTLLIFIVFRFSPLSSQCTSQLTLGTCRRSPSAGLLLCLLAVCLLGTCQ